MIKNIVNNKIYIGQSSDIQLRWTQHKRDLNNGIHHNCHLQSSWQKYGEHCFEFIIIEECLLEKLDEREIYWINYYDSYNNGYNLDMGGKGCRGYKHTEEELYKMREIQHPKHVIQCDRNGNYIKEWQSIAQISKTLGYSKRNIEACCNKIKNHKTSYGFLWFYKDNYESNNIDWNYYLSSKKQPSDKWVSVKVIDIINNIEYIFSSKQETCKQLNIGRSTFESCLKGKGQLITKYKMYLLK